MNPTISTSFVNITKTRMKNEDNKKTTTPKLIENGGKLDIRKENMKDIPNIMASNYTEQPSSSTECIQNRSHRPSIVFKNTIRKLFIKLLPSCKFKNKLLENEVRSKISSDESLLKFYDDVTIQTISLNYGYTNDDISNADETLSNLSFSEGSIIGEAEHSTLNSLENTIPDLPYDASTSLNDITCVEYKIKQDIRSLKVFVAEFIDDIMNIIEESLLASDNNKSIQIDNVIINRTDKKMLLNDCRRNIETVAEELETNIRGIFKNKDDAFTNQLENFRDKLAKKNFI
ncbi:uncharacterized protein LOC130903727 [Diorhabda carinulata]|uniref:uncharacterized protein LOC130903727 n=1 Tax=Diorhabda carinulata TaxID=1163345 RepID=UPI0025A26283|nr:uncharacterized protein LOC130903727 [Diorhabda carinulata]